MDTQYINYRQFRKNIQDTMKISNTGFSHYVMCDKKLSAPTISAWIRGRLFSGSDMDLVKINSELLFFIPPLDWNQN